MAPAVPFPCVHPAILPASRPGPKLRPKSDEQTKERRSVHKYQTRTAGKNQTERYSDATIVNRTANNANSVAVVLPDQNTRRSHPFSKSLTATLRRAFGRRAKLVIAHPPAPRYSMSTHDDAAFCPGQCQRSTHPCRCAAGNPRDVRARHPGLNGRSEMR